MELVILVVLLVVGYTVGTANEKRHYKSLAVKEAQVKHIALITGEWKNDVESDDEGAAFSAGVVVGADYFKTFVSGIRNIFGGRVSAYESLLDRGRREAIARMTLKANKWGAHKIVNVRIETSTLGTQNKRRGLPCVELFAYGTALRKTGATASNDQVHS